MYGDVLGTRSLELCVKCDKEMVLARRKEEELSLCEWRRCCHLQNAPLAKQTLMNYPALKIDRLYTAFLNPY